MPTAKIQRRGQITIPSKLRQAAGLKPGDFVDLEYKNDQIILKPTNLVETKEVKKKRESKEKFFRIADRVRKRTKDVPLEEIEEAIGEAVEAAKKEELKELKAQR